jgi:hypothetical protein
MAFGRHAIADPHVGYELADFDNIAGELVANHERRLAAPSRPVVPFVDVHIRTADSSTPHTNQHFVIANRRNGNVRELKTRTGVMLDEGPHSNKVRSKNSEVSTEGAREKSPLAWAGKRAALCPDL